MKKKLTYKTVGNDNSRTEDKSSHQYHVGSSGTGDKTPHPIGDAHRLERQKLG